MTFDLVLDCFDGCTFELAVAMATCTRLMGEELMGPNPFLRISIELMINRGEKDIFYSGVASHKISMLL